MNKESRSNNFVIKNQVIESAIASKIVAAPGISIQALY